MLPKYMGSVETPAGCVFGEGEREGLFGDELRYVCLAKKITSMLRLYTTLLF